MTARLTDEVLDLDTLIDATVDPRAGALVVFGGTVRNHHQGRDVTQLAYSAYAPLAETMMRRIERETVDKFGVQQCRLVHRTGALAIGDVAVYAVVRAAHRREAFAAAQYAVDTLKHTVPVWKEEFYADGTSAFVQGCCLPDADDATTVRARESAGHTAERSDPEAHEAHTHGAAACSTSR